MEHPPQLLHGIYPVPFSVNHPMAIRAKWHHILDRVDNPITLCLPYRLDMVDVDNSFKFLPVYFSEVEAAHCTSRPKMIETSLPRGVISLDRISCFSLTCALAVFMRRFLAKHESHPRTLRLSCATTIWLALQ